VRYVASRIWADDDGRDRLGPVLVIDQQILTARDAQKLDGRPGGFGAVSEHGVLGEVSERLGVDVFSVPTRRATHRSGLRLSDLPHEVGGVRTRDTDGNLIGDALPVVEIVKTGGWPSDADAATFLASVVASSPLAGIVGEGATPIGRLSSSVERALLRVVYSGAPVVKVARGGSTGRTEPSRGLPFVTGSNLTATKARLLLIASMLKLGPLPAAADPDRPTTAERDAILDRVAHYQELFDRH
jgi:hypothetical protein